jgi:hypothetical protein
VRVAWIGRDLRRCAGMLRHCAAKLRHCVELVVCRCAYGNCEDMCNMLSAFDSARYRGSCEVEERRRPCTHPTQFIYSSSDTHIYT